MFAVQQLLHASAFREVMGPPAWRRFPSWYLVPKNDQVIPPDLERFFAKRMQATTVEIDSSLVEMVSHPDHVTDLIVRTAKSKEENSLEQSGSGIDPAVWPIGDYTAAICR